MSYKHGIGMSVCINGRATKEYSKDGTSFIEARHGTNYTVKLKNDNGYKVMAVLSVDGLDVVTGKPAEDSNKGYILDPYSSVEIKGYRISDKESAAFIFTSKGKSYVQQTSGDARNSGVIGVRVFGEKSKPQPISQPYPVSPWNPFPYSISYATGSGFTQTYTNYVSTGGTTTCATNAATYTTSNNTLGCYGTNAATFTTETAITSRNLGLNTRSAISNTFDTPLSYKQFDTGTGWGKKLDDRVKKEYFDKGELLAEIVSYYASREALETMGIDLSDSPRVTEEEKKPQAFGSKYCQPPTGWVG
jgi:hypothetical protein